MEFGITGVPLSLAQTQDYELIFSEISAAGITNFVPVTLYDEMPSPAGTGFESDFFPPPYGTADPAIYDLMREYGIKLVVPAEYLYPTGTEMPSLEDDPLAALIAAAGADLVGAVYNYDEPVLNGIDPSASIAVYERVKAIDPSIEVVQVHAEVPSGASAEDYLAQVLEHAAGADSVGFAVYTVGPVMGAPSPYSNGASVSPVEALADYAEWLQTELPNKSHVGILQGFGLRDLFSEEALAEFDPMLVEMARAPTQAELLSHYAELIGMDSIYWAGTSYLDDASDQAWLDILQVSRAISELTELQAIGEITDIDGAANAIAEDAAVGSGTGIQVLATDPDAENAVSYGVDDPRFSVAADGRVVLKEAGYLDFGVESSLTLTVTATSSDGSSSIAQFEVSVLDTIEKITGTSASEELIGTLGADVISGSGGQDWLWGINGDDLLIGGKNRDHLIGGIGNDELRAGAGGDFLMGEEGDDVLTGGAGKDVFLFGPGHGDDTITDFQQGLDIIAFLDGVQFGDLVLTEGPSGTTIYYGDGSIHLDSDAPVHLSQSDFFI